MGVDLVKTTQISHNTKYVVSLAFQYSLIMSHQGSHGSLKFSNTSLCTCHNLLTPEALHILTMSDASVLTSAGVKPLVDLNHCYRSCLLCQFSGAATPYGLHNSLCTLHLLCSDSSILRHKRNTQYGWLVRPYPTGTLTLQDASRLNLTL